MYFPTFRSALRQQAQRNQTKIGMGCAVSRVTTHDHGVGNREYPREHLTTENAKDKTQQTLDTPPERHSSYFDGPHS
jgi:hypothetical protein